MSEEPAGITRRLITASARKKSTEGYPQQGRQNLDVLKLYVVISEACLAG